ncbi:TIGR03618 family F420-dependent PPOX class oxidoreductase [Pseudonocardia benzenivorans]|uniref:F420-dependent enzyme n=2 Tax=Pseudonocardia TaxID=1847 RepID=F4CWS8_PSEUX|nr:TIGR03618 family F420-dependent PPOX class oxidoreductase [Pseudonocardia dioxanivorans]AEA23830.1 putative F420-dependent enzyme [Pseudonocardia dioxanivorans CB1190]GJF01512.1 PPOX class F420-dependent enzyme [Pseudonocardia sp. D17]
MTELNAVWSLAARESYLAVVSITRADGSVHSSLVNAGPVRHPVTGEAVVGYVTYGRVKLANLRERPASALSFRSGWKWATIEGTCEIIGPDDPADGVDDERLRLLLREVFAGAGGSHDDWDAYDRVMREERRAAVLMTPTRVYGNA